MVAVPLLLDNPSQKYVVRVFGQVVSNTGAYRDGRYVASELVLNLGWGTMHAHVAGAGGVNVPTSWGPQHVRADVEVSPPASEREAKPSPALTPPDSR